MDSFQFLRYPLEELPFVFLALLVAFTIHEFAHAYFAYQFGDPTAKEQGRVSLNPMVHLDIVGTLLIFIAGFGWAKPVPVNRNRFKYPRLMGVIVSAVGPLSNLVIAFIGMIAAFLLGRAGLLDTASAGVYEAVKLFFHYLIGLNVLLFIFNLIPLPPLDGYRIVEDVAPHRVRLQLQQYEQWGMYIFLLLVFIPPLFRVTLAPIFALSDNVLAAMHGLLQFLFGQA